MTGWTCSPSRPGLETALPSLLKLSPFLSQWQTIEQQATADGWLPASYPYVLAEQERQQRHRVRQRPLLHWAQLPFPLVPFCLLVIVDNRFAEAKGYGYVRKDEATTLVLLLVMHRYERSCLLPTDKQPFCEWKNVFSTSAMAMAAVDRLVDHSMQVSTNCERYLRRRACRVVGHGQELICRPDHALITRQSSSYPLATDAGDGFRTSRRTVGCDDPCASLQRSSGTTTKAPANLAPGAEQEFPAPGQRTRA